MCISISELGAQPQLPHAFMVKTLPPEAAGGAAGACGDSQGYEWDGSFGSYRCTEMAKICRSICSGFRHFEADFFFVCVD